MSGPLLYACGMLLILGILTAYGSKDHADRCVLHRAAVDLCLRSWPCKMCERLTVCIVLQVVCGRDI